MLKGFTDPDIYDSIFTKYTAWEEVPVSTLNFTNNTSQLCYIALPKEKALEACTTKAVPRNIVAYEYKDNMYLKNGDVILGIEIDTSNMLDLTNKTDYTTYITTILNNKKLDNSIPLLRNIEIDKKTNQYKIVYSIRDNRCVKNILKIQ